MFDWHLFAKAVPFVTPNLLSLSVTVPGYVGSSAPDFRQLESELESLSINLLSLQEVRVRGHHEFELLDDEAELRRKLELRGVNLSIYRGEGEHFLAYV